jgi:hypothetical protein
MGDRGMIGVEFPRNEYEEDLREPAKMIYLYTHWGGSEVAADLARALQHGGDQDPAYLCRRIFEEMRGPFADTSRHFGITPHPVGDAEYAVPIVRWRKMEHFDHRRNWVIKLECVVDYADTTFTADGFVDHYLREEDQP